jgi:hypothetical protein
VDTILDVKIRPPVADLRNASQALDGQHSESEFIAQGDLRLVLLNGGSFRGGRKIAERPVRDSASGGTLCRDAVRREDVFFGLCMTEDGESIDSKLESRQQRCKHGSGSRHTWILSAGQGCYMVSG